MAEVTQFSGEIEIVKELPDGDKIKLDILDGWNELIEDQKVWLSEYFNTFPQRLKTCMQSGISTYKYNKWLNSDSNFNQVLKLIEEIHAECLSAVQYMDSYSNSKVRTQQLKAMNARGYEKKQTEHKHLHLDSNSMSDYLKSANDS